MELWDTPVSPEPAFAPFRRYNFTPESIPDDGRRETAVSSFVRKIFTPSAPPIASESEPEPRPRPLVRGELAEMQIFSGKDQGFRRDEYLYLLSSLSGCREPLSFELISGATGIAIQLAVALSDVPIIREQLAVFFPDCVVAMKPGALRQAWDGADGEYFAVVEFGLAAEFMRPLRIAKLDPYLGLVGALGELREGELSLFQVIFEPVRHAWGEHALRAVSNAADKPFFVNAPELHSGAQQKTATPLYAAVLRIVVRSSLAGRVEQVLGNVAASLRVFDELEGNGLIPVENGEYGVETQLEDALSRQSRRSGMILSADELIGLVHIPSTDVRSAKLIRQDVATRAVPAIVSGMGGLLLGENTHAGVTASVLLNPEQRMRHMHVVGASGTGKSTFLFNLARQDIENGGGLAVLDPHGDLVDRILGVIPSRRIKDVVLLDPSDTEFPVGFNILHAHSELEKTLLASDLVSVFQRLSTSWGDQMGSVLSHAVLAFLESDKGGSLLDLRRFLLEPPFRASFLETVRDPEVVYYWQKGFSQLSGGKSIGPIMTRLETFLTPKSIRYMVAQRENRLDFADIMDTGKIFLAKLSQGAIGRENSYLLGTLLVSKFQQLAMARQGQAEGRRRDFLLYVDEFHNFITPSMAEILSGARKYRLGFVLAHQELRQLERDREVSSAVMSNAYSRICFRVGDADARALESGFTHFEAKDLQNLGTGEAICRVERSDYDFNLKVALPSAESDTEAAERRREVINASRSAYARPRLEVEAALGMAREERAGLPIPLVKSIAVPPEKPTPIMQPLAKPEAAPARPLPPSPLSTPGRGGKEHKYLQTFIKQWAEGMGWRTTIEAPVPKGAGSVDVLLSKGEVTVACEISMTTSTAHEIRNLEKCARGGFTYVVSVCTDGKHAQGIETEAKGVLDGDRLARMRFLTPPQLFSFVGEIDAKSAATDTTVKGYRVKVSYRPVDQAERAERMENVAGVIAKSLKRIGSKKKP